jgi:long-chain acyl-CoA synthetase
LRLGSVGRPLPGVQARIADDGGILIKGPNIFNGYYRDAQATLETLVDGWLHTGDLGRLDEDGFLFVTGRQKDIIITAGGKNITPANLENALRHNRWISQAVVLGDGRPYLVALITLDAEERQRLPTSTRANRCYTAPRTRRCLDFASGPLGLDRADFVGH